MVEKLKVINCKLGSLIVDVSPDSNKNVWQSVRRMDILTLTFLKDVTNTPGGRGVM